jgi:hypothetical protein
MHNLLFTEPACFYPYEYSKKDLLKIKPDITVNDYMYELLIKNNCLFINNNNDNNAYVFGKLFDPSTYKFICSHGNDVAQTGLIDLDLVKEGVWFKNKKNLFFYYGDVDGWDDPKIQKRIRIKNKAIVWFGVTSGGDVGANLFVHYDKNNNIDSILIDVHCLNISGEEEE